MDEMKTNQNINYSQIMFSRPSLPRKVGVVSPQLLWERCPCEINVGLCAIKFKSKAKTRRSGKDHALHYNVTVGQVCT